MTAAIYQSFTDKLKDGLTLAEAQELLTEATAELIKYAQTFGDLTGPQKKQIVMSHLARLVDAALARIPLPWPLQFLAFITGDTRRAILLELLSGTVEYLVPLMFGR